MLTRRRDFIINLSRMVTSFDSLEHDLSRSQWLNNSAQPTGADLKAFDAIKAQKLGVPKATCHARTFAWYSLVSRFSEDSRKKWDTIPEKPAADIKP